jgi:hypothetical protein
MRRLSWSKLARNVPVFLEGNLTCGTYSNEVYVSRYKKVSITPDLIEALTYVAYFVSSSVTSEQMATSEVDLSVACGLSNSTSAFWKRKPVTYIWLPITHRWYVMLTRLFFSV